MKTILRSAVFWVTSGLLIVSITCFLVALRLPGGEFDPLGPGAAPEMVSATLVVLCLFVLLRTLFRDRTGNGSRDHSLTEADAAPGSTPRQFLFFLVLLVAYITAFHVEAAHFIAITAIFLFGAIVALGGFGQRSVLIAGIIAAGLSVFLFVILTRFFVIRLPGAF